MTFRSSRKCSFFCLKHPRIKFNAECIEVNQEKNKAALEEKIQGLVDQEKVNKYTTDTGMTLYCSNRTEEELAKLIEILPSYKVGIKS